MHVEKINKIVTGNLPVATAANTIMWHCTISRITYLFHKCLYPYTDIFDKIADRFNLDYETENLGVNSLLITFFEAEKN